MKLRFLVPAVAAIVCLAVPLSSGQAESGAKKEWHDWVGPLDWCGFDCDAGESCCTVVVVQ
jgi:hypothetical protein